MSDGVLVSFENVNNRACGGFRGMGAEEGGVVAKEW